METKGERTKKMFGFLIALVLSLSMNLVAVPVILERRVRDESAKTL